MNDVLRRLPEWPVYIIGLLPAVWFLWLGMTGGLGVEPISALEHKLGVTALQFLIASLLVTPLRRYAGVNLLKFRRAFGLLGFIYVCLHLLTWLVLDMSLLWAQIVNDIVERPYITIGVMAFVPLVPLAMTSTKRAIRRMGPRWQTLHRLSYVSVVLGGVHFVMQEKVWTAQSLIYLGIAIAVVAMRLLWRRRRVAR
ncbi:MAG: protein-methionine-sulfoxide reductase heme-binding subunit MsrQ [Rhodobacteraceae bacterium CG17_big_fil_post_rev_8_21_14_2_50_65_11]|nr:MAG: protein-methionine-sulfoxide reductase heme-binding subunit MsrQ [Rhodobacteraceae bacterium CG17_big_fil_post_rev_8_21_14_2_50_65_11]